MANVYERLGVRTIINAKVATRLSGGIMRPEVTAAMVEASQHCVEMAELQARASEIIAEITGAEAGLVTAGAAAGLLLGAAACVTGLDAGRMNRLPDTRGHGQRDRDRALSAELLRPHDPRGRRAPDRGRPARSLRRAGARDAEAWEIADALSERTAAVHWVAGPSARPARAGGRGRPCRRRAGLGRRRGAAAARGQSQAVHAGRSGSGGVLRRQGDRRAAGLGHPLRPALSHHGRRAAEPGPRRVLRVGSRLPTSSTRRGSRACRSTASAAAARSARRKSSAFLRRCACSWRTPRSVARAGAA